MKVYLKNKVNGETNEVKLVQDVNNGNWWCDKESGNPIMKCCMLNDMPTDVELVFDCVDDQERIGNKLLQLRGDKNLSYRQMEMLSGVQFQNIKKNETGQLNQSVGMVSRLAYALGYKLVLVPIDLSIE